MVLKEFLPKKFDYSIYVPTTSIQETLYRYYLEKNPAANGKYLLLDYASLRKIWTHPQILKNAHEKAMMKAMRKEAKKMKFVEDEEEEEEEEVAGRVGTATSYGIDWWSQFVQINDLESLFSSNKLMLLFHILRMCQERGEKVLVFSGYVMVHGPEHC